MSLEKSPRKLKYTINQVKDIFQKVSLTPEFRVTFDSPPTELATHFKNAGLSGVAFYEKLELLCNATSLPGSSFDTFESIGSYQGQFETFPSMRDYGRQISLTFFVDKEHQIIRFFEEWINFINPLISTSGVVDSTNRGQNLSKNPLNKQNINRMRYPSTYRFGFLLTKFEKDVGYDNVRIASDYLTYEFIDAFPVSISPMRVAYGTSNILTMTVTMSYQRYITRNKPNTYSE
ncbi:tail tube [Synechococcus phage DSL-LC02]|nr:tail tube [Synechococcus phage DSL-LC02]